MSIVVSSTVTYRTALDIIKRALRLLGVYSLGEEPSAEEAVDGLTALNAMVETMSLGLLIHAKTLDTIPLTADGASFTIGPSGDVVSDRPIKVHDESYIEFQGVSYPLQVLTLQEYNDVCVKASGGIPVGIWCQMDMPDAQITMWPVPSEAMTLKLWSDKLVAFFPGLTTPIILPPGYEELLAYCLTEAIAPEYQMDVPRAVEKGARRSRKVLKRNNLEVPKQRLDLPAGMGYYADWRSGV